MNFLILLSLLNFGPLNESNISSELTHEAWDNLLKEYVTDQGRVDYKSIKMEEEKLDQYLTKLSTHSPASDWSKAEKMAYWINAYNAFTVKLILDHYPVSSIMDIENGNPWDVKWINIGGETYSLNQIEHSILRPQFKDARIHFAVNCAALSCPPLHNRAWTAKNLEQNLEQQTKKFINNSKYNTIDTGTVKVSKIFDWYKEDFGDNLVLFLNKYLSNPLPTNTPVSFQEYDWKLNKQ